MRASGEKPATSSEARHDVVASFAVTPLSPSVLDAVRLFDYSYDPGRIGLASRSWDFGDGTTTDEALPSHRYREDGDFTVTLTVTTTDGRIARTEQIVHVATHDVAVTGVTAPSPCAAGDSRRIVVSVASPRRPETVQVELVRVDRHGVRQRVGLLVRKVEAAGALELSFPYIFTPDDAATGPLTFEALATIVGARDALPADNKAAAPPTIVHS